MLQIFNLHTSNAIRGNVICGLEIECDRRGVKRDLGKNMGGMFEEVGWDRVKWKKVKEQFRSMV